MHVVLVSERMTSEAAHSDAGDGVALGFATFCRLLNLAGSTVPGLVLACRPKVLNRSAYASTFMESLSD